jgi:hypothetical protein
MALAGVAEGDRCKGWKTGKCLEAPPSTSSSTTPCFLPDENDSTQLQETCPDCQLNMRASSVDMLNKIKGVHKKLGVDGLSQCDVQSAGNRRGSLF